MKKKLFAASISLTMAFIMMVSSSFAWYTVSTTAEIEDVQVTMSAQQNLEIARANGLTAPVEVTASDGTNENTWGAIVTGDAANTGGTINFVAHVPENSETTDSTLAGKLCTVKYNDAGRTDGFKLADAPTTFVNGEAYYTTNVGANATENVAYVYGVWLRSNTTVSIKATDNMSDTTNAISVKKANGDDLDTALAANIKAAVHYSLVPVTISNNDTLTFGTASNTINLTANTPQLVAIVVYLDGANIHAQDILGGIKISNLDVHFEAATEGAIDNDYNNTASTQP